MLFIFASLVAFFIVLPAHAQPITNDQVQAVLKAFEGMNHPPSADILRAKMQNLANHLPELQEEELAKYMSEFLGHDEIRTYADAREFSRKNLERILGPELRDGHRFSDYDLARAIAHEWLADFRHNTNQFPGELHEQPFWYSSRELRKLNLPEGEQSRPFNTDFVGTGNWIFFYVGSGQRYGPVSVYVGHDHAQERGLIFPFVMTMEDLALTSNQSTSTEISVGDASYRDMLANADLKHKLTEARKNLGRFVFTPDDFEKLAGLQLARLLSELERNEPSRYQHAKALLQPGKHEIKDINTLMRESFARAKIPLRYEMRIPVAVPTSVLSMPNCAERVAPTK